MKRLTVFSVLMPEVAGRPGALPPCEEVIAAIAGEPDPA